MQNNNVILPDSADQLVKECAELGNTSLLIAANGELVGIIAVADCVKIGSPQAVEMLKQSGRTVILLTGDNIQTADSIAKQVGIDSVLADVLPEQKAKAIANLQQQGNYVAMVGDGVNDAVALVQANIGIAIGTGTDIARESAQVVIQTGDLRAVDTAIRLSSAVVINIKENLFWAFIYNIIGIPVAMGIFYPVWGWTLSPMLAAAGMSLSSICVVLNALRLKNTMI